MCNETSIVEIDGEPVSVDACLSVLITALNAAGMKTLACCCGHGQRTGKVALTDGREVEIHPLSAARVLDWSLLASAKDVTRILECHAQ